MKFNRLPQERVEYSLAIFDVARDRARQAGQLTFGCEGLGDLLQRGGRVECSARCDPSALRRDLPNRRAAAGNGGVAAQIRT
eukprot:9221240-Pyramimonas_sp.AAC.1